MTDFEFFTTKTTKEMQKVVREKCTDYRKLPRNLKDFRRVFNLKRDKENIISSTTFGGPGFGYIKYNLVFRIKTDIKSPEPLSFSVEFVFSGTTRIKVERHHLYRYDYIIYKEKNYIFNKNKSLEFPIETKDICEPFGVSEIYEIEKVSDILDVIFKTSTIYSSYLSSFLESIRNGELEKAYNSVMPTKFTVGQENCLSQCWYLMVKLRKLIFDKTGKILSLEELIVMFINYNGNGNFRESSNDIVENFLEDRISEKDFWDWISSRKEERKKGGKRDNSRNLFIKIQKEFFLAYLELKEEFVGRYNIHPGYLDPRVYSFKEDKVLVPSDLPVDLSEFNQEIEEKKVDSSLKQLEQVIQKLKKEIERH